MEFIVGTAIGLASLAIALLAYRHQKKSTDRHLDLQLWKKGDRVFGGYVKLRNDGRATATVDLIKVVSPRSSKIAWFATKGQAYPPGTMTLEDSGASDKHVVKLIVEPGETAGVGMTIGLPVPAGATNRITLKCRLHPADRFLGIIPMPWRKVSLPLMLAR